MSEVPRRVSLKTARRMALYKQHLAGRRPSHPGPSAIMDVLKDIRYLQLDPTSVVAQSHLLVLWSRLGAYRTADLDKLMWKDRKLQENFAHAASLVLTEDWPLYLKRSRGWPAVLKGRSVWYDRITDWMSRNSDLRKHILDEIRRRGPLQSRDFEDRSRIGWGTWASGWRSSSWNKERNVSRMLEFMFYQGTIMVAGRQGKQKLWDLTERIIPAWAPRHMLSEMEVEYDGAQKSLKALGAATQRHMVFHFLAGRYPKIKATLRSLEEDARIVPVTITDSTAKSEPWFIHSEDLKLVERLERGEWEPRTTLLSPFDNLIVDRDRTHLLFDYFFRIEIYTPRHQRKHGFFVLSLLDGDRIIGRLDPWMDRDSGKLLVRALHAEPGAPGGRAVAERIADALGNLAEFLGATEVVYPAKIPEQWKSHLK